MNQSIEQLFSGVFVNKIFNTFGWIFVTPTYIQLMTNLKGGPPIIKYYQRKGNFIIYILDFFETIAQNLHTFFKKMFVTVMCHYSMLLCSER